MDPERWLAKPRHLRDTDGTNKFHVWYISRTSALRFRIHPLYNVPTFQIETILKRYSYVQPQGSIYDYGQNVVPCKWINANILPCPLTYVAETLAQQMCIVRNDQSFVSHLFDVIWWDEEVSDGTASEEEYVIVRAERNWSLFFF